MKVIVEVSAKHLHISKKDLEKLFGKNYKLNDIKDISQPGQFACKEILEVIGKRNSFKKVRIVGPERKNTQLELSISDAIFLGVEPVIKVSGNHKNTPGIILKNKNKKIKIKNGVIVSKRHLHISPEEAKKLGLKNRQKVEAIIKGKRAGTIKEIVVRFGNYNTRLHLDTDEANAFNIKNGSRVELKI